MRALLLTLALFGVACSPPPATTAPPPAPPSAEADSAALLAALTPVLAADLGRQSVTLEAITVRVQDDWGWLEAQPQGVDWSATKYAVQAEAGVLDGNGTTYALLKRENGAWRVLDFVVGPTDVAYADWPARHGAPPELMGLPPSP